MHLQMIKLASGVVAAAAGLLLTAGPVHAHGEEEEGSPTYVLSGDLHPDDAIPGPGPESAKAVVHFFVVPEDESLCYEIERDEIDRLTGYVIRLGEPDVFDSIVVDFDSVIPDRFEDEALLQGLVGGCVEVEYDLLEFLVHEAPLSHVTVSSGEYPQGAAGGFLTLQREPEMDVEHFEEDESYEAVTSMLGAVLATEDELPDPPGIAGAGEVYLEVTPDFDEVCWEIAWELDEAVTIVHLHEGGPGEVDPEEFRLDFIKEARNFGGTVDSDLTTGCISVTHLVDFFGLVETPEQHYVDVHTEEHPAGALRGQLVWEGDFVTTIDEDHDHDKEDGREPVDYIPHIVAALALLAVAVFATFTLRRARGLYEQPAPAGIAASAVAATLLTVSTGLLLLDVLLAPSGDGTVVCTDYDRYGLTGLSLALVAALGSTVAIGITGRHPPLRRVAFAAFLGSATVALAWVIWTPPQGCSVADGELADDHIPTTTIAAGDLDCDDRVFMHGDPAASFEGYATPEEAVAASAAGELGPATDVGRGDWLVEIDGRPFAKVTVDVWRDDRYVVFDTELCADVESQLGR